MKRPYLAVLAALLLGGCRPQATSETPGTPEADAPAVPRGVPGGVPGGVLAGAGPAPGRSTPAPIADELGMVMIEQGSEPRRLLRLAPKPNAKEMFTIELAMSIEETRDGALVSGATLPIIVIPYELRVTGVEGDVFDTETTIGEPSLRITGSSPAEVVLDLRDKMETFAGVMSKTRMSTRGGVEPSTVELPSAFDPAAGQTTEQINKSLRDLAVPLPREPVGAGARWSVTKDVVFQGISMRRRSTYELRSCTGAVCHVGFVAELTPLSSKVNPPGTPPGVEAFLSEMMGGSSGLLELEADHILPANSQSHAYFRAEFSLVADGQSVPMTVSITSLVRLVRP